MNREEVIEKVNKFLIDEFEIDEELVTADANLRDDLDIESLDFVDIAVEIEKEFHFKLKNEEVVNIVILSDLYDYILSKIS